MVMHDAAELMHDMIQADFWQPLQLFLFDIIERTSSIEKHVVTQMSIG